MELRDCDVIFVSNALANGGAARVISVLAGEFVQSGLKVGVAVYAPHKGEYELLSEVAKEYGTSAGIRQGKIHRIIWLRNIARRNPHAVIVAFEYFVNMQTIVACAGLPNKVIVSERNDPARVGAGFPGDWLRERLYRRADMLVCQTDDAADHFSDRVKKCVILNPIKDGLPEPYKGGRRKAIVSFCRLEKQKNLPMLIRAFSKFQKAHTDYTLEIYGDGRERGTLLALVGSLGLEDCVSILPSRQDVHDVVKDASMFVLPSDYEGLSNSMLEAMALGLPVICTDCPCGGARMVIKDGENGILIPVGDEQALCNVMTHLAGDEEYAERIARNAAEIRSLLTSKKICTRWMEVIRNDE